MAEVGVTNLKACAADVKAGAISDDDHSCKMDEKEREKFLGLVEKRKPH